VSTDFSIFYKEVFEGLDALAGDAFDLFVSAYNTTDRVRAVFDAIQATEKRWVVHREYEFTDVDLPNDGTPFTSRIDETEGAFMRRFVDSIQPYLTQRLCIDISGFMRPHLLVLLRLLQVRGVKEFDALYAEPARYVHREDTEFTQGGPGRVRTVEAFAGIEDPSIDQHKGLLIIAAGYEHELIREVAADKNDSRKLQLLGFPSLRPDFYQENRLNAYRAAQSMSDTVIHDTLFAPAYDPFVTAEVIQETITHERAVRNPSAIYLAPISSRPQALGIGLYWLFEGGDSKAISVIYPFRPRYVRDAAAGIKRIWKYHVELPTT
jgi:hypothetical protein